MGIGFAEGISKLSPCCIRTDTYGKTYLSASPLGLTWWVPDYCHVMQIILFALTCRLTVYFQLVPPDLESH